MAFAQSLLISGLVADHIALSCSMPDLDGTCSSQAFSLPHACFLEALWHMQDPEQEHLGVDVNMLGQSSLITILSKPQD